MSKLTINWNGTPLDLLLVNEEKGTATFRYRSDVEKIQVVIRHSELKQKGIRGTALERHVMEATVDRYPTADDLGSRCKAWVVLELEESTPTDRYGFTAGIISNALANADFRANLRLGAVTDIDAS